MRVFADGGSRGNPGPAAIGVVIEDDQGMRLRGLHRYLGTATNNQAEYEAVIEGLKAVADWKPDRLEIFLDSKVVVEQLNGRYRVKEPKLMPLHARAKELLGEFPDVVVAHIGRERNRGADALVNRCLDEHVKKTKAPG